MKTFNKCNRRRSRNLESAATAIIGGFIDNIMCVPTFPLPVLLLFGLSTQTQTSLAALYAKLIYPNRPTSTAPPYINSFVNGNLLIHNSGGARRWLEGQAGMNVNITDRSQDLQGGIFRCV
jgi:hypothetical protein